MNGIEALDSTMHTNAVIDVSDEISVCIATTLSRLSVFDDSWLIAFLTVHFSF